MEHLRRNPHDHSPNLRKSIGVFLIMTGVAGLFLPFLQGVLFISIGFLVLTRKDWKRVLVKRYDKIRAANQRRKQRKNQ